MIEEFSNPGLPPQHRKMSGQSPGAGDRGFADSPLEEAGFELLVPLATEATSEHPHKERSAPARGGPMVRIPFPPADSQCLARIRLLAWKSPVFCGWAARARGGVGSGHLAPVPMVRIRFPPAASLLALTERTEIARPHEGLVTGMGIERQRWGAYHEPWLRFRIAVIAFRPRSFSTRSAAGDAIVRY